MIAKSTYDEMDKRIRQMELTFNAVPDLILILDNQHKIIKANKAMADRLGTSPQALKNKNCYEIIHGTDEPPKDCPHNKLLSDGREHCVEVFEERLSGSFMVTVSPLLTDEGKTGCVHVAREITGQKKIEEALQESEQRFRFLFENSLDCVVILDRDLNYIYANQAAHDYLGLKNDTIAGKNIRDALAAFPEFRDLWIERLTRFFETQTPRWTEDSINLGDTLAWSESSLSAIHDDTGNIVAIGIIYRDISERKAMETEKNRLIAELKGALAEVKTLHGLLPICSTCKKIRDDKGYWNQIEQYIGERSHAVFSHGICPDCANKMYSDMNIYDD